MVEVVRLYSNPEARLETLQQLLLKATSARRPNGRLASRQNQVRLESHKAKALAAAYLDGETIKELAQQYGVHRTTVSALLRRSHIEPRQRGLAANEVATAVTLYGQGWSCARLGAKFGVDAVTVWRALRMSGVAMRSSCERRR